MKVTACVRAHATEPIFSSWSPLSSRPPDPRALARDGESRVRRGAQRGSRWPGLCDGSRRRYGTPLLPRLKSKATPDALICLLPTLPCPPFLPSSSILALFFLLPGAAPASSGHYGVGLGLMNGTYPVGRVCAPTSVAHESSSLDFPVCSANSLVVRGVRSVRGRQSGVGT